LAPANCAPCLMEPSNIRPRPTLHLPQAAAVAQPQVHSTLLPPPEVLTEAQEDPRLGQEIRAAAASVVARAESGAIPSSSARSTLEDSRGPLETGSAVPPRSAHRRAAATLLTSAAHSSIAAIGIASRAYAPTDMNVSLAHRSQPRTAALMRLKGKTAGSRRTTALPAARRLRRTD
jgi:hypothetical protein